MNEKKRVCIISSTDFSENTHWGGIHTHVKMLCDILLKLDYDITLLIPSCTKSMANKLFSGININRIDFLQSNQSTAFSYVISEGNSAFELFRRDSFRNSSFFYFLHIPSFIHFYNNWIEISNLREFLVYLLKTVPKILHRIFFREIPLMRVCDKILSVSALKARQLPRFYMISREKILTVNNWVDTVFFSPNKEKGALGRQKLDITQDSLVFLAIGGIWRPKGFHIAIEAFSRIAYQVPQSILLICGEGKEKENLVHLSESKNLEKRIFFPGKIEYCELSLIYNSADIFLMTSLMSEGQAYTLIEAMSCGLPVIASKRGGNIETVGNAGILVSPGNIDSFAKAMTSLVKSPELRQQFALLARKRVLDNFSQEVALKRFEGILDNRV